MWPFPVCFLLWLIDHAGEEGLVGEAGEDKEEGAIQCKPDFILCDPGAHSIHGHDRKGGGGAALLVYGVFRSDSVSITAY